jgi:[ribosomal protein S5]-alanine N-acetyltransferase
VRCDGYRPSCVTPPVVVLRALTPDDLGSVVRWSHDEVFCRANGWDPGRTPAEVRRHWANLIAQPHPGFLRLGAEADGELVGYADFADIQHEEAELGFAIGDSSRWGTGLGTATARAMSNYGFEHLGLSQIRATVHETNRRSVAVLEKVGFRRVGVHRTTEEYLGELTRVLEFALRR